MRQCLVLRPHAVPPRGLGRAFTPPSDGTGVLSPANTDRKSTRLNSSHRCISYAVSCLKKKELPLLGLCCCGRRWHMVLFFWSSDRHGLEASSMDHTEPRYAYRCTL